MRLTLFLCLGLLLGVLAAGSVSARGAVAVADGPDGEPRQERLEPREGERCLLCGRLLSDDDHVLRHRGRRVPLCGGECTAAWNADPARHFAELQPRAALFQEALEPPVPVASGWFWFAIYVVLGLACGAACAYLAVERGRPAAAWFGAGLALNLVALAWLGLFARGARGDAGRVVPRGLRKVPTTSASRACTSCGRPQHPDADRCLACGAGLEPRRSSEARRATGVR